MKPTWIHAAACLAAAALGGTAAAERFEAGPAEFAASLEDAVTGPALLSREEYLAETTGLAGVSFFVAIKTVPDSLSANARFGMNLVFGGKNRGFVVDGDEVSGFVLLADMNGDGDLRDERTIRLDRAEGRYVAVLEVPTDSPEAKGPAVSRRIRLVFDAQPETSGARIAFRIDDELIRRGEIQLAERRAAFALVGVPGSYDTRFASVWIDLDGDGSGFEAPESFERFRVPDRRFRLGAGSYEFEVDPWGEALTVRSIDGAIPDRPRLEPGTRAPDFLVTDLDGKQHSLETHRGSVLLLQWWSPGCSYSRRDFPGLVEIYRRYHERGFEVLGISGGGAESVRARAVDPGATWPQAIEPSDGPVHSLFRVVGWPRYFLLDREGRIAWVGRVGGNLEALQSALEQVLSAPRSTPTESDAGTAKEDSP